MDIRFSSPPLDVAQPLAEVTITGRNYDTYHFDQSLFEDRIRELEALTRLTLRPGQVQALQSLAEGKDVVLVAKTGYGKTLVFTGYNFLLPPTIRPITLIISPLIAIEQDQAEELKNRFGDHSSAVVLDGKNNTAELRAEIARGNYTHVWASAEVVLADLVDCSKRKPGTVRRPRVKSFSSGYIDHGSFHSVAQDEVFRRRLQLLAIDELHLCASTSWGGSFRVAMGQIAKLRDQFESHTRVFGTTATLTPTAWEDIQTNAGIRTGEHLSMIQTNIYREDVFLYILPTDDVKSTYKRVLYTALERSPSAALLLRVIFFVETQQDTILLRDDIVRWLRAMNRWSNIVSSYHGDLTTASRVHIHEKFVQGELRILCSTIAYALGVNPPEVKFVIQRGRCSPEDAMQKLGRANRSRALNGGSVFIWLPEAKVFGPRWSDLDAVEQERLLNQKRKPRTRLPGELERIHVSELLSDRSAVTTARGKKIAKPKLRKNAPPELWRQEVLSDDEYKLYNPGDRCLWEIMLNFFDQKLMDSNGQAMIRCNNCNSCRLDGFVLSELHPEDKECTETEEGKQKVRDALDQLAERLSKQPVRGYLLRLSSTPHINQFLTLDDRKRFTDRYYTVAGGDLMGWPWKKKYGVDVIQAVCKAIGHDPSPSIIEPAQRASHGRLAFLPTLSSHNASPPSVSTSFSSTASTDLLTLSRSIHVPPPPPVRDVLQDITNTVSSMTARGSLAVNKSKRKRSDANNTPDKTKRPCTTVLGR